MAIRHHIKQANSEVSVSSSSAWVSGDQDMCMDTDYTAWLVNEHLYLDGFLCAWWRHQIETFSALLTLCAGIWPVSGKFPSQRPVTRIFDVFFDLRLNKRLSKQSWSGWFKTPSRSLWRHCNVCRWKGKQQMVSFMDVKTLRMVGDMTMITRAPSKYKDRLFQVWDSHVKDKTVSRPSYL